MSKSQSPHIRRSPPLKKHKAKEVIVQKKLENAAFKLQRAWIRFQHRKKLTIKPIRMIQPAEQSGSM